MVYSDGIGKVENMTEENCNTSQWGGLENKQESTLITKLMALFKWLKALLEYFVNSFSKEEVAPVA